MIVDDAAVVFLNNNLIKNKRKLTEVNNEMSKKTQEVSKLQEKLDGLSQGAKYGAYDELNEASIFEPMCLEI
jgi:hypothetical protein